LQGPNHRKGEYQNKRPDTLCGRERPLDVKSIEDVLRAKEKKKEERRKREQIERESEHADQKATTHPLETT
jgi:hypothetical protein